MGVTVTRNFGPLDAIDLLTQGDWMRVGRLARKRIIERTLDGKDEDGQAFTPYSDAYAALKSKIGAGSGVNLQLSGAMLQGIQVEADDDGATLTFV